jgi:ATP-dependent helicase/nuclease subunit B
MKLLIGQANSGKTTRLLLRMADFVKRNQGNPLLLVPSTSAAEVLLKRVGPFLPQSLPASAKPVAVTFPYFADSLLKRLGSQHTLITAIQRYRMLKRIIEELATERELAYFDRNADKPGLVNSLAKFIDELWNSGTDAKGFAALTRNRTKKDSDLALIFKRYEEGLRQAKAMDSESATFFALQALESLSVGEKVFEKLKSNYPLIIADGFDFYTPVQVKLLASVSRRGIEAAATLSYEEGRAVSMWQQPTLSRFLSEGAELITCESQPPRPIARVAAKLMLDSPTESDNESRNSDESGGLKEAGWSERGITEELGTAESTNRRSLDRRVANEALIRIISAADRAEEVRAVAREVKRLVLEDHYAPEEITILCRSLHLYAYHLENVFAEFAIPLELDNQMPLAEHPLIVSILALLKLETEHFQRRAVIESLRSPYFDHSVFCFDETMIDLLEHISFDERIMQTRDQWIEALEHTTRKPPKHAEAALSTALVQTARENLLSKLVAFFDGVKFPQRSTRQHYMQQILRLVETLKVEEKIGQSDRALLDDLALKGLFDVLKSLGHDHELMAFEGASKRNSLPVQEATERADRTVSWQTFYQELASAVAATSFSRPRPNTQAILAQEAHNLRPRMYQAIFVIGLIEGEFPRKSTETTPYTLAERKLLRHLGIDFSETRNDVGADLTQFHKALTRASERLYLSYARTDLSGGELLRSYLIDEVIAVGGLDDFRQSQVEKGDAGSANQNVASLEELALLTARQMRWQTLAPGRSLTGTSINRVSQWLARNLKSWPATLRGAAVERRRLSGRERGIFGGVIKDEHLVKKIRSRFGEDYLWSATRLNDYGLCPFRFLACDVLNLASVEEPTAGFAPDRLGVAYHEILEQTFKTLKEQELELGEATLEEALAIAENVCEMILQKLLDERHVRQSALWEFEKSEMKKRIKNLLRAEAVWVDEQGAQPVLFEQSFGFGSQPPLIVEGKEGKIRIRGTIDRVDKNAEGLVVIDYKTSRSPISPKEALEGRNLQLPIYLMAANRLLKLEGEVANGYYLHIYSCKKGSQFPNKNSSVEAITERAEDFINDYVGRTRRAEFPIEPNQNRCPPYCEFDVMCRVQSLGTALDEET